jgi:hypothetical protein
VDDSAEFVDGDGDTCDQAEGRDNVSFALDLIRGKAATDKIINIGSFCGGIHRLISSLKLAGGGLRDFVTL